ncbi:universal stress protein UspA [Streptomyces tateyamensis]|uniref:Universal stress protein UspA n=1 Tax=Streptomyces tateyamensis TaxID=565073 RepID=A0A2V4NCV9_9ACTN|nr:universal stress protein [Streptomyces tateyamensis]PYC82641.1 universal stress protein UspA [Streptomyces tateyamensis]
MSTEQSAGSRIVVGVDGSPSLKQALRWAVDQAERTGAVVEAVACWAYPTVYGWGMTGVDPELPDITGKMLAQAVAEVVGDDPPVEIRESVVLGNAAEVLLDRAHGAERLVVGNRGHGGFSGALLGSVGQHCVQHAHCSVVVVRDGES